MLKLVAKISKIFAVLSLCSSIPQFDDPTKLYYIFRSVFNKIFKYFKTMYV